MNPVERYGIRIAILFTMLSMLVASALSEYLAVTKEMEFVTVHAAIGGGIGLTGQFLIEEIKQSAPKFFKSLLNILTSTLIDNIVETIVMFFDGVKRRIKKWLPK
jgi:phosphate/sulfate permease